MGAYWLTDLPDVIDDAGVALRLWDGWETRARSSGGYDHVWGIVVHHTASQTAPDNDCRWEWETSSDRPIGAMLLDRTGRVTVGAAGATNCAGKGGAYDVSHGTIPLDKGNAYTISIEAANNGVGEPWPFAQTDAYVKLVAALCAAYDLDAERDVIAHCEWAPTRKIDPAGPSPWATGSASWDMDAFRYDVTCSTNEQEEPVTQDDINAIAKAVWAYQLGDPVSGDKAATGSLLGWMREDADGAHKEAHRAAEQTEG